jgi:hypothetical protein
MISTDGILTAIFRAGRKQKLFAGAKCLEGTEGIRRFEVSDEIRERTPVGFA